MAYVHTVAFYNPLDDASFTSVVPGSETPCAVTGTYDTTDEKFGDGCIKLSSADQNITHRKASGGYFSNADANIGTLSFWVRPGYSGAPGANNTFFQFQNTTNAGCVSTGLRNFLRIRHLSAGGLEFSLRDVSAVSKISQSFAWSPTSGEWYHIEVGWDGVSGSTKLFLDGVEQWEDTATFVMTQATYPNQYLRCVSNDVQFHIDDIIILEEVWHTSNFTSPTQAGPEEIPPTIEGIPYLSGEFTFEKSMLKFLDGNIDALYENTCMVTVQTFFEKTIEQLINSELELVFENSINLTSEFNLIALRTKYIDGQFTTKKTVDKLIFGNLSAVDQNSKLLTGAMTKEKLVDRLIVGLLDTVHQLSKLLPGSMDLVYQNSNLITGKITIVNYIPRPRKAGIYQRINVSLKQL